MATIIKCKKDLYHNDGTKSFSKGCDYVVDKDIYQESSLMDLRIVNDQMESHIISSWWREFKIVKTNV